MTRSDADKGSAGGRKTQGGPSFAMIALNWLDAATTHSLPDRSIRKGGKRGLHPVVLNPSFVEALMGLPPNWTEPLAEHVFALSVTLSSRSAPRSQGG